MQQKTIQRQAWGQKLRNFILALLVLPTLSMGNCTAQLPQGFAMIAEPEPGGIFWQLIRSSNGIVLKTPSQEPVSAVLGTFDCQLPSTLSLISAKVTLSRNDQEDEELATALTLKDLSLSDLATDGVRWDLDSSKLTKTHIGSWSVQISTLALYDQNLDATIFQFELVIMAGCKEISKTFATNEDTFVWPSSDFEWASINHEPTSTQVRSFVPWLTDSECKDLHSKALGTMRFITSSRLLEHVNFLQTGTVILASAIQLPNLHQDDPPTDSVVNVLAHSGDLYLHMTASPFKIILCSNVVQIDPRQAPNWINADLGTLITLIDDFETRSLRFKFVMARNAELTTELFEQCLSSAPASFQVHCKASADDLSHQPGFFRVSNKLASRAELCTVQNVQNHSKQGHDEPIMKDKPIRKLCTITNKGNDDGPFVSGLLSASGKHTYLRLTKFVLQDCVDSVTIEYRYLSAPTLQGGIPWRVVDSVSEGSKQDIMLTYVQESNKLKVQSDGQCKFGQLWVRTVEINARDNDGRIVASTRLTFKRDCTKLEHFKSLDDQTVANRQVYMYITQAEPASDADSVLSMNRLQFKNDLAYPAAAGEDCPYYDFSTGYYQKMAVCLITPIPALRDEKGKSDSLKGVKANLYDLPNCSDNGNADQAPQNCVRIYFVPDSLFSTYVVSGKPAWGSLSSFNSFLDKYPQLTGNIPTWDNTETTDFLTTIQTDVVIDTIAATHEGFPGDGRLIFAILDGPGGNIVDFAWDSHWLIKVRSFCDWKFGKVTLKTKSLTGGATLATNLNEASGRSFAESFKFKVTDTRINYPLDDLLTIDCQFLCSRFISQQLYVLVEPCKIYLIELTQSNVTDRTSRRLKPSLHPTLDCQNNCFYLATQALIIKLKTSKIFYIQKFQLSLPLVSIAPPTFTNANNLI